mmetsp:Transcript_8292/g.23108  ORF Transcript_8292/g.23108 Transcript_8292/m.23108 type:complete len:216 (-) Transcript_8292:637-1284(-)
MMMHLTPVMPTIRRQSSSPPPTGRTGRRPSLPGAAAPPPRSASRPRPAAVPSPASSRCRLRSTLHRWTRRRVPSPSLLLPKRRGGVAMTMMMISWAIPTRRSRRRPPWRRTSRPPSPRPTRSRGASRRRVAATAVTRIWPRRRVQVPARARPRPAPTRPRRGPCRSIPTTTRRRRRRNAAYAEVQRKRTGRSSPRANAPVPSASAIRTASRAGWR